MEAMNKPTGERPSPGSRSALTDQELVDWLLQGDVSIRYQVSRDVLGIDRNDLRERIATEGWGRMLLSKRNANGHWGRAFYQPKWTCSHYTLLDLRNLELPPGNEMVRQTIDLALRTGKSADGGILLGPSTSELSDVCVNGMFLNYASYFNAPEEALHSVVDCILKLLMQDGGFNCRITRSGARHSSLHSTISVLEGLTEFQKAGYRYRADEILAARESATAFILLHRLFLSDHTGQVIHKDFLKLAYPPRWKYDILRALDFFRHAGMQWDERLRPAIDVLVEKRNGDGTWNMQAAHPGEVYFVMEKAGQPGRWNTLRALRVLKHFELAEATDRNAEACPD